MIETIKFLKTRSVKSPSRANKYDAGIDFYVPEFTEDFLKDLREKNPDILIQPVSCLLYTSPSPRDRTRSRMPSSA